jgi:uncharacterized membrane protein YeaQ/YmgE (transglycosylase-associated protein family)
MYITGEGLLVILLVGLVAGWLAERLVSGGGFGVIGDIAIGIVGAFIGTWLLPRIGVHVRSGTVGDIIVAAIGAIVLLLIVRLLSGGLRTRRWSFPRRRWW